MNKLEIGDTYQAIIVSSLVIDTPVAPGRRNTFKPLPVSRSVR